MGLCLSFDCGDCDVCCNPCCLALSACCLVPCLCPNACGQQQQHPPQTVIVQQPPVFEATPLQEDIPPQEATHRQAADTPATPNIDKRILFKDGL
ncbi:unnamed protein product [Leptidea sinapis]|uniref:Uncharacterized protein n=1 Tax=Leptidea sinapis TaxID=189913 RepID=A0A5E4Q5P3_9NEOP|nr:unnamed protein product [Leptidea sinapis]